MRVIVLLLVAALLAVGIVLLAAFSGFYNVAAGSPDTPVTSWFFRTVSDRSIRAHARGIVVPPLNDPGMVEKGFEEYEEMCATCHGAPGRSRSATGQGLNPAPPDLVSDRVSRLTDAELFWIVKNGIRRTGMPAYGPTHGDPVLWSLVAFVRKMQGMTAEQYSAMARETGLDEEPAGDTRAPTKDSSGDTDDH